MLVFFNSTLHRILNLIVSLKTFNHFVVIFFVKYYNFVRLGYNYIVIIAQGHHGIQTFTIHVEVRLNHVGSTVHVCKVNEPGLEGQNASVDAPLWEAIFRSLYSSQVYIYIYIYIYIIPEKNHLDLVLQLNWLFNGISIFVSS